MLEWTEADVLAYWQRNVEDFMLPLTSPHVQGRPETQDQILRISSEVALAVDDAEQGREVGDLLFATAKDLTGVLGPTRGGSRRSSTAPWRHRPQ